MSDQYKRRPGLMTQARLEEIRSYAVTAMPAEQRPNILASHRDDLIATVDALQAEALELGQELTLRRYEAQDCHGWAHTDTPTTPYQVTKGLIEVVAAALYRHDEAIKTGERDVLHWVETPMWVKDNYRQAATAVVVALFPGATLA